MNAKVPATRIDLLTLGQETEIRVDAFPKKTFGGKVVEIKPLPDPSSIFSKGPQVYTTLIEFDNSYPELRPGLTAEASILVSENSDTIQIPSRSVIQNDGNTYVAIRLPESGVHWREVTLGNSNGRFVEVIDGISSGELSVVDPILLLRRGPEQDYRAPGTAISPK